MKRYIKNIFKCRVVGTCRAMFSTLSAIVVGTILSLSLQSCSDNINENIVCPNDNGGKVEVTFMIPNEESLEFGTRVDGTRVDATDSENTFNNIYLVYQFVKDGNGNSVTDNAFRIIDLTNRMVSKNDPYRYYAETFLPGQYRFFVAVNFDEYLGDGNTVSNSITTIDEISSKINNFNTDQTILANHLPMGCLDTEMIRNGYKVSTGIVTISSDNTNVITAPLTFLCAKVRYTILFDATENGISKEFGEKRIRFDVSNDELPYAEIGNTNVIYGQEQNITNLITNPGFYYNNQASNYGWTINPGTNGFEQTDQSYHTIPIARHYYENFNRYQVISNREPGLYRLEVNGFYRYGRNYWWDTGREKLSWQAHLDGTEQMYAHLYVNDSESPLMCLYDEDYGDDDESYQNSYPYWESEANTAFIEGQYLNTLNYILQEKGSLTIGVKKESTRDFDWTCFDNFKLFYTPMTIVDGGSERRQDIDLGRYEWPSKGVEYPGSANDELTPWSGSGSIDDWYSMPAKAWQGVTYLPENLSTDNKTVLHFPYCFGNQTTANGKEKTITLFDIDTSSDPKYDNNIYRSGLKRGMFYDVRIQVVTSQVEEDEFTLFVRVKDWKYNPEESSW